MRSYFLLKSRITQRLTHRHFQGSMVHLQPMSRKRILAITPRIPFPPLGGEKLKTYHSLKALAESYDVDWFSLHDGSPLESRNAEEFERFKKKFKSFRVFEQPKWKSFLKTGLSFAQGKPLQVGYFQHQGLADAVRSHFDLIDGAVAFLIRTAGYLDHFQGPKILDMTDSISFHYQQAIHKSQSFLWKNVYSIEAPRLRDYEEKAIHRFSASFFVNNQEAQSYPEPSKCIWLPLGVSKELFQRPLPEKRTPKLSVSFLGKMNYQPNIEAVQWFCREILPSMGKDFSFYIVGAEPSEEVKSLARRDSRVQVTGFLEDPFTLLQKTWAVVAPLQIGGGIQNKVLEAMALGCPVLMTSLVAKPLNCPPDVAKVLDKPEDWIRSLKELSSGTELFEMGVRARAWMKSWGDWDEYERKYSAEVAKIFGR